MKSAITVESLLGEFEQLRAAAMGQESRQFNAANTAIKGKAVLTGKWIERAEVGLPGEFDHLSDEELEAASHSGGSALSCGAHRSPPETCSRFRRW